MSRQITIFDTTLRDGEQSPGCSMNLDEKLEVAQALVDLGVDVIEAGFPIASPGDFEAVREIADTVRGATICGLARCNEKDIDRAWRSAAAAAQDRADSRVSRHERDSPRIQAAHGQGRNRRPGRRGREAGARASPTTSSFRPKTPPAPNSIFCASVVEAAIDAGATTVNIPDTVGYATPPHYGGVIKTLVDRVPNIDQAVISVHCHNDLGLAVANSLAAVEQGAGQIECTINGLGERAGNCSLEEVVMALRTRHDYYQADTRINTPRLVPTSRLVSSITGMLVQRNKAIVGRNAFAHEAGIHQDGMLKEPSTYEIMRPEDVGFTQDRPRARQTQRPGRAGRPGQGAGLSPDARAARRRLRGVQEARRQEEGNLRRRHCRADRRAQRQRRRPVAVCRISRSSGNWRSRRAAN